MISSWQPSLVWKSFRCLSVGEIGYLQSTWMGILVEAVLDQSGCDPASSKPGLGYRIPLMDVVSSPAYPLIQGMHKTILAIGSRQIQLCLLDGRSQFSPAKGIRTPSIVCDISG